VFIVLALNPFAHLFPASTEHIKKKLQNFRCRNGFRRHAEKNFVAFERLVGINKAFPAKAQSAQRIA
jgi:hypothetical protein